MKPKEVQRKVEKLAPPQEWEQIGKEIFGQPEKTAASKNITVPREIRSEVKLPSPTELTEKFRFEGPDGFVQWLGSEGLTARQIALLVERNWKLWGPLFHSCFAQGGLPEISQLLRTKGVIAAKKGRRIKFLKPYESGINGEIVCLKGDEAMVRSETEDSLVAFMDDDKAKPVSVFMEDKGEVWKFAVDFGRIAAKAKE